MTETYDKLNHWYGWNGGECPVHPETVVQASGVWGVNGEHPARCSAWDSTGMTAFRIIKLHVEPKVFWVNEYSTIKVFHDTEDGAKENVRDGAIRIAVRYVEQPL